MQRREARLNELRLLKRNDPLRLIELFSQVTGIGVEVCGELPPGYGFERIIWEILDREDRCSDCNAAAAEGAH